MIDWLFRSRETGRITIVQLPNVPFAVFIVASVVRAIVKPEGKAATAINGVAVGALAIWAIDELIRGVNPWRRMLGMGILAWQGVRLFSR